jgi:hypothetical protein
MFTSPRPTARAAITVAAVVATSLLAAACGSAAPSQPSDPVASTGPAASTAPGPSPAPQSPGSAPPAQSAPASPPASPAPAKPSATSKPSPTAPGGAALATCRTASLRITLDDSQAQGAAGSAYYPLNFTNTSAAACQMYGFPGVSFAAAAASSGRQIGVPAQRNQAFAKMAIRLAPGATAHAWVKVTMAGNYPASSCQPVSASWLRIYPPGETVAGYVGHAFSACAPSSVTQLSVLPVRAGKAVAGVTP